MSAESVTVDPSSAPSKDLAPQQSPSHQPSFSNQSESTDYFTIKFVAFENVLQDSTNMQQIFEETMEKFTVHLTSLGTTVDKITTSCKYITSSFVAMRRRTEQVHAIGHLRATRDKEVKEDERNLVISFNEGHVIVEFEMSFTSYYVDVSDYNTRFLGWVRNNYATMGNELVSAGIELVDVTFTGYTNETAPIITSSPTVIPSETPSTKPSATPVSLLNALNESTNASSTASLTFAPTISPSPTIFQGYVQSNTSKSAQLAIILTTGCIALVFLIRFFIYGNNDSDKNSLPFYETAKKNTTSKKKKKRNVIESDDDEDDDDDDSGIYIPKATKKKSNNVKSAEAVSSSSIPTSAVILDSSDDVDFVPEASKDISNSVLEEHKESSEDESSINSWEDDDFSDPLAVFSRKKDLPQDRKSKKQHELKMVDHELNEEESKNEIHVKDMKPKRSLTKPSAVSKRRSTEELKEEKAKSEIQIEDVKPKRPVTRKSAASKTTTTRKDIEDDISVEESKAEIHAKDVKPKRPVTRKSATRKGRASRDVEDDLSVEESKAEIQVEDVKPRRSVTRKSATSKSTTTRKDIEDDISVEESKAEIEVEDVKPKRPVTRKSATSKSTTTRKDIADDISAEESKAEIEVEDVKPKRPVTESSAANKSRSVEDLNEMEDDLSVEELKAEIQIEDPKSKRPLTGPSAITDLDEMEDDLSVEEVHDVLNEEKVKDKIEDTVKSNRTLSAPSAVRKRRTIEDLDDDLSDEEGKKESGVEIKHEPLNKSKNSDDIDDDLSVDETEDEIKVEDTKPEISIAESFAASFLDSRRKDLDIVIPPSAIGTSVEKSSSSKSPSSILKKDDEFEDLVAIVDKVLAGVRLPKKLSYAPRFRRAMSMDMHAVHEFLSLEDVPLTTVEDLEKDMNGSRQNGVMPFYVIIEEKEEDGGYYMMGISLWSFGYSTWKGRVMNLELLIAGVYEQYMMTCLAKIAQSLDCQRIEYRAPPKIASVFKDAHGADLLSEWITLRIGRTDMTKFLQTKSEWSKKMTNKGAFGWFGQNQNSYEDNEKVSHSNKTLKESIDIITEEMNKILEQRPLGNSTSLRLRQATKYDARSMIEMVHELADFESAPNEVTVSSSTYKRDMGGPIPMFHCILVETVNDKDLSTEVVGYCVFYITYSPKGKYLWLEDLFIEDEYRRLGCGKALMYILSQLAVERKYHSLLWQVLEWNKIALDFYEKLDVPKVLELEALRFDSEKMNQMLSKRSKSTKVITKTATRTVSKTVKETR